MKYAPIALFVYNRPKHLLKTLNSLKKNAECKDTDIYIFSDGYKIGNLEDEDKVNQVRKIIRKINFFKKKIFIKQKSNIGLRNNILNGINFVFKKNSSIIVLEDDLVVSKYFLKYMNESLAKYKDFKKVWHISAWNYNVKNLKKNEDAFFIKNMNCWGWGTWKNRWTKIKINSEYFLKKFSKKDKYNFNLENSFENFSQITRNYKNNISTWAIFWNATIFLNKGLCLNPIKTLSLNIGQDNSGTNTVNFQLSNNKLNKIKEFKYPNKISENIFVRKKIIDYLRGKNRSLLSKILRYF